MSNLDSRYVDLGSVSVSRKAHLEGLLYSTTLNISQMKRDARFSPPFIRASTLACKNLIEKAKEPVEMVLFWGATNVPVTKEFDSVPYAVVTDGPFDPDDPGYPIEWRPQRWHRQYLRTQREVFDRARHIFTLSEWARQKVLDVHHQDAAKVTKCGWGPLGSYFTPRFDPFGKTRLVLSVGSDWRRKGMDLVGEVGGRLHKVDPAIHTVIAGIPGDLTVRAENGLSLLPISTPSPLVHSLMRMASCLVIAARFDASPHVIYEALQYGTPVVGTRVCGIPEAIEAPLGGEISNPNSEDLFDAVHSVLGRQEASTRRSAYDTWIRSGGWEHSARIVQSTLQNLKL